MAHPPAGGRVVPQRLVALDVEARRGADYDEKAIDRRLWREVAPCSL
jgi:hypothetical protein